MRKQVASLIRQVAHAHLSREEALSEIRRTVDPKGVRTAQKLFLQTLRQWWMIEPGLKQLSSRKIPLEARVALVMTVVQIRQMDAIPEHAAKSEFQKLIGARYRGLKGFLNWLLNEWLRQNADWPKVPQLPSFFEQALQSSLPPEFVKAWLNRFSEPVEPEQFEDGILCDPASRWAVSGGRPVEGSLPHLDLCSAPGNKLMLVAQAHPQTRMFAVESNHLRFEQLQRRVESSGLTARVELLRMKAEDALRQFVESRQHFDSIFLDAPCSAWGTIRAHPEYLFQKSAHDASLHQSLQQELFRLALQCLSPGGVLTYCVCTFSREETIEVSQNPGADFEELMHLASHGVQTLKQPCGQLAVPGAYGQQIFYTARFRRLR